MKAVILAAGIGIRERVENIPTCLMKIGGETFLERQIKILKEWGIKEIVVVVGKEGNCWTQKNIDEIERIAKKIVINPLNATTPSSSSLVLGLNQFKPSSCLVIDGDIIFEGGIIKELIENKCKRMILIEKVKGNSKGNYVELENDYVKLIGGDTSTDKIYAGLMKIDDKLYQKIKDELQIKKNQNKEFIEILNKYLTECPLKALNLESIDGKVGDIFNLRPLTGGSFANTRIISKSIRKTSYIVRKEADTGRKKLIDEIKWIRNLPPDIKSFFPSIINYKINKKDAWYEMEYHNLQTLRNLLINRTITDKEAIYLLKTLIKIMFSKVYNKRVFKQTGNYAQDVHLQRIKSRIITIAEKSNLMDKIINSKYLIINGKKFYNLPTIINLIEKDKEVLKKLEPPFLNMVHGDLHFDNFVVDISQMPMAKFVLLDPRGLDNTYNYTYDLGKLWHSFHGKYDLTHEGLFNMDYSFKGDNFEVRIEFSDHKLFLIYNNIYEEIKKNLREMPLLKKDPNWELRTYFSEMSHFCSVMPFHMRYDNKEKIAIALYVMGVRLANEFALKYCKNYGEDIFGGRYTNVNTLKDYNLAKKKFERE